MFAGFEQYMLSNGRYLRSLHPELHLFDIMAIVYAGITFCRFCIPPKATKRSTKLYVD